MYSSFTLLSMVKEKSYSQARLLTADINFCVENKRRVRGMTQKDSSGRVTRVQVWRVLILTTCQSAPIRFFLKTQRLADNSKGPPLYELARRCKSGPATRALSQCLAPSSLGLVYIVYSKQMMQSQHWPTGSASWF